MVETRTNPAVLAGLMSGAALALPDIAVASPLDDIEVAVSSSLVLQIALGAVAGASLAAVVSILVRHFSNEDDNELLAIEQWGEHYRANAAHKLAESEEHTTAGEKHEELEATGKLGRVRQAAAQASSDQATTGNLGRAKQAASQLSAELSSTGDLARKRHPRSAQAAPAPVATPAGKHFASAQHVAVSTSKVNYRARHMRVREWEGSGVVRISDAELASATIRAEAAGGRHFKEAVAARQEQHETSRASIVEALPSMPSLSDKSSYYIPQVTEAFSRAWPKTTASGADPRELTLALAQRVANRARGVAAVLAERLGAEAMADMPVITRVDGSVGDVGAMSTASLTQRVGNFVSRFGKPEDTIPRAMQSEELLAHSEWAQTKPEQAVSANTGWKQAPELQKSRAAMPAQAARGQRADESRAAFIARSVAEVNVGMFPEPRRSEELEGPDEWELALKAMGENIRLQHAPVFEDVIGGPSTIDDPEGLEAPTGFIPFRVPAGRPDVVDASSYVDYLLDDELSKSDSPAVRFGVRSRLRVIEGGTSPLRKRKAPKAQSGKHFAPRHDLLAQQA